jgi:hypothetical protein
MSIRSATAEFLLLNWHGDANRRALQLFLAKAPKKKKDGKTDKMKQYATG